MKSQKNLNTNFKVQFEKKSENPIQIMSQETENLAITPEKKENKFRKLIEKTELKGISMLLANF